MSLDLPEADAGRTGGEDATTGGNGGGDSGLNDGSVPPKDARAVDTGLEQCGLVRVPVKHRVAANACPSGRGAGFGSFIACGANGCAKDGDCTAGANGRCLPTTNGARCMRCSYDECANDSACAGKPCNCRTSDADTAPNVCASESDCSTDADCGACGFCSPSQRTGTCGGLVWHCHTANDACLDDADCNGSGCNFDSSARVPAWRCGATCSLPPG